MQAPFFKPVSQADKITVKLLFLNTDPSQLYMYLVANQKNCLKPRLNLNRLPKRLKGRI